MKQRRHVKYKWDEFHLDQATQDEESSFHESQGYEQIIHTTTDLFFAGSETTSSTLAFAILFMVREPEVQERVRTS